MNVVEEHGDYFVQKRNAVNVLRLSCFQKVTAAMRMLTYGVPADATDEYIRIGRVVLCRSPSPRIALNQLSRAWRAVLARRPSVLVPALALLLQCHSLNS